MVSGFWIFGSDTLLIRHQIKYSQALMAPATSSLKTILLLLLFFTIVESFVPRKSLKTIQALILKGKNNRAPPNGMLSFFFFFLLLLPLLLLLLPLIIIIIITNLFFLFLLLFFFHTFILILLQGVFSAILYGGAEGRLSTSVFLLFFTLISQGAKFSLTRKRNWVNCFLFFLQLPF